MNAYRARVHKRTTRQIFLIVFTCLCVGATSTINALLPYSNATVGTMQVCLFVGIVVFLVFQVISLRQTLKSDARTRNLYRKEHFTRQGAAILNLQMFLFSFAAVITGYFDDRVFYTLGAVVIFLVLLRCVFESEYRVKRSGLSKKA